ncbi:no signficant blast hit [Histoplasma capsulatum var. duboisii H88]|uniref:No signficant blast hit n=1 Tax=Ajellomyces capsulatus (strain H88) TaxID=544711 RepID=A0A8A1LHK5_AJEC8|nr:no signficant blast hit [Histoplasma capsulatum var. duboisii H88]
MPSISPQQRPRLRIPLMMMVTMMMAMMMTIVFLTCVQSRPIYYALDAFNDIYISSYKPAMVYPLLPFEPTANSRT